MNRSRNSAFWPGLITLKQCRKLAKLCWRNMKRKCSDSTTTVAMAIVPAYIPCRCLLQISWYVLCSHDSTFSCLACFPCFVSIASLWHWLPLVMVLSQALIFCLQLSQASAWCHGHEAAPWELSAALPEGKRCLCQWSEWIRANDFASPHSHRVEQVC